VRFEPTVPASERAKTVQALDRSATVTGGGCIVFLNLPHLMEVNDWRHALTPVKTVSVSIEQKAEYASKPVRTQ
jgi:hypothetical protein